MNTIEFKSLITPSGVKFVQVTEDGVVRNSVPANDHVSIRLSKTASDGLFQILNSGDLGSYRFKRSQVTAPFSVNDDHLENILRDYFFCNGCTMYPPPPCNTLPPNWGQVTIRVINNNYVYGDPQNNGCITFLPVPIPCPTECIDDIAQMVCLKNATSWANLLDLIVSYIQTSSMGAATANYIDYGTHADITGYLDMSSFDQATKDIFCNQGLKVCTLDCGDCTTQFTLQVNNVLPPSQITDDCNFTLSGDCADWITFPYQISPGDDAGEVATSIFNSITAVWGPLGYIIDQPNVRRIRVTLPCGDVPALWSGGSPCQSFDPNNPASFPLQVTANACNAGSIASIVLLDSGVMTVNQNVGQTIEAIILEQFTCSQQCA